MATSASSTVYPLDPTGALASNKITGETQTLSVASASSKFRLIIPTAAPFYVSSMSITYTDTTGAQRTLTSGVDYYPAYVFISASRAVAAPVAGGLVFMNTSIVGTLTLTYQTLGGIYTLDYNTLLEIVANATVNPIVVSYEEITGLPSIFPPIAHDWDVTDLVGMDDVVNSIDALTAAYLQSGDQGLAEHEADHNNPHDVTAAQTGAYTTTQTDTAIAAAATVAATATAAVQTNLNTHEADKTNPHDVTATQVGLGNVPNYAMATNDQAVAGTSTTTFMSPRAVLLAMNAGPSTALNLHIYDVTNPHQVTAAQVGLGNVSNYPTAGNADTATGTSSQMFVTPAGLTYALNNGFGATITNHIANTNNPHQVTAAQVNLGNVANYGVASTTDATNGVSNALYMTPLTVKAAINGITATSLTNHINNTSNPHNVTAAQVGSYTTAQADALLANKLATTAQAADSAMLSGQTVAQLTQTILTGTAANATQFGGYTVSAYTALVLEGTAANADALGGQSLTALDSRYILVNAAATQGLLSQASSGTSASAVWLTLGTITLPSDLTVTANQLADLQWMVAGGDAITGSASSLYYLRMHTRGGATSTFKMASKSMGDYDTGATFGYTVSGTTLTLWMKSVDNLQETTITELVSGVGAIATTQTIVTTAPSGIVMANA